VDGVEKPNQKFSARERHSSNEEIHMLTEERRKLFEEERHKLIAVLRLVFRMFVSVDHTPACY
jgi:hypothetical protein